MDEIVVEPYDLTWPARFETEVALLRTLLPLPLCRHVEHFGSTAVPGLDAKPIIDILLGVDSLEDAITHAVPLLESVGYNFWRDNPDKMRLFLVKGLPPSAPQRTHHLHVVTLDSPLWERLLFRDYLHVHPDEVAHYAALKRELAQAYPTDRDAYTDAKGSYIAGVTEKARMKLLETLVVTP